MALAGSFAHVLLVLRHSDAARDGFVRFKLWHTNKLVRTLDRDDGANGAAFFLRRSFDDQFAFRYRRF